ncbi:hypothetical protein C0J52_11155 [Blattella germanica]|nr:hypothetical protein C0J52_11155 [Blattella germanica]
MLAALEDGINVTSVMALDDELISLKRADSEETGRRQEGDKRPQHLAAIVATLGAMAAGCVLGWTSPALPQMQMSGNGSVHAEVTDDEASWIGSLVAVGALLGALPAGFLADLIGRRLFLLSLGIPFTLGWCLILLAHHIHQYTQYEGCLKPGTFAARFILGLAVGAVTVVVPLYNNEIAEDSVRGALGAYLQFMITTGILWVYVFGALVRYDCCLPLASLAIPLVFCFAFFWMPESPVFLLSKGHTDDAEKSIRWLRGASKGKLQAYDVDAEVIRLQKSICDTKSNPQRVDLTHKPLKYVIGQFILGLSLRSPTAKAIIIVFGLMTFQQLSGINAVIFYTGKIFEDPDSFLEPTMATIIVGTVQVLATYSSSLLVDRLGRRILLLASDGGMATCLFLLSVYFYYQENGTDISGMSWLPLVSLASYIILFSIGLGPLPWFMMAELVPAEAKGWASALAVCLNWTLVFTDYHEQSVEIVYLWVMIEKTGAMDGADRPLKDDLDMEEMHTDSVNQNSENLKNGGLRPGKKWPQYLAATLANLKQQFVRSVLVLLWDGPLRLCLIWRQMELHPQKPHGLVPWRPWAYLMYVGRFLGGIALGTGSVITPIYCEEIAEVSVRGAIGVLFDLQVGNGILWAYVVGAYVPYLWLCVASAIMPVFFFATFIWMPESPIYLMSKGKFTDAENALRWLRGAKYINGYDVTPELERIKALVSQTAKTRDANKPSTPRGVHQYFSILKEIPKCIFMSKRSATIKAVKIVACLMILRQLSGINAIIFFTTNIFDDAGSTLSPTLATIVVGVIQIVFTYFSSLLVERVGRRMLLLLSDVVMAVCHIVLAIYFYLIMSDYKIQYLGWLPIACIGTFMAVFNLGFGPLPWVMMAELVPNESKSWASGLGVSVNWILVFVITNTFGTMVESVGPVVTFGIFGGICAFGTVVIALIVPETKGKTREQIRQELEK